MLSLASGFRQLFKKFPPLEQLNVYHSGKIMRERGNSNFVVVLGHNFIRIIIVPVR